MFHPNVQSLKVGLAAGQDLPGPEEHGLPRHLLVDVRAPGADAGGSPDQGGTRPRPGTGSGGGGGRWKEQGPRR